MTLGRSDRSSSADWAYASARIVAERKHVVQRQDSLEDQMRDVIVLADIFGCCDAADWIKDAYNAAGGGRRVF